MSAQDSTQPKAQIGVAEKRIESRFPSHAEIEFSWIGSGDVVKTARATVTDHSGTGLGLDTESRLRIGTMIWMRDADGDLAKAVVRYSRNSDDGNYHVGVRLIHRERRAAGRDPVRGGAELKWSGPTGRTCSMVVTVVDLSGGGAGVVAPHELDAGQIVQLIGEQFECFCSVRNCHDQGEGGFRLGLLFARDPHDRLHTRTADWID